MTIILSLNNQQENLKAVLNAQVKITEKYITFSVPFKKEHDNDKTTKKQHDNDKTTKKEHNNGKAVKNQYNNVKHLKKEHGNGKTA